MAKTKLAHRAFALSLALLFLVTSLGFSGVVIWQLLHKPKTSSVDQTALQKEGKLEGTKLSNFTPVNSIDKLDYKDEVVGTGDEANTGSTLTFHYTGALAKDGTIFQSSHDTGQPITYPLTQLIPGWQKAIPGMKAGGKRRLFIPWSLAYGEAGSPQGGIPPKADLVFDIELVSVKNP